MLGIPWRDPTDWEQYDFNVNENFHDNVGVIRNLITKHINWNRLIYSINAKESLKPMKDVLQLKNTVYAQMIKKDEEAKKTDNLRVSVEGRSALYALKNMHLLVNHTVSYAKKKKHAKLPQIQLQNAFLWCNAKLYVSSVALQRQLHPDKEYLLSTIKKHQNLIDFGIGIFHEYYSKYAIKHAMESLNVNYEHIQAHPTGLSNAAGSAQIIEHKVKLIAQIVQNHNNNHGDYFANCFQYDLMMTTNGIIHDLLTSKRLPSSQNAIPLDDADDRQNYQFINIEDATTRELAIMIDKHVAGQEIPTQILDINIDSELRKKINKAATHKEKEKANGNQDEFVDHLENNEIARGILSKDSNFDQIMVYRRRTNAANVNNKNNSIDNDYDDIELFDD